jgi:hypothetical protein
MFEIVSRVPIWQKNKLQFILVDVACLFYKFTL